MILINLLPHREAARKRKREAFFASLGAAAVAGGLIAGGTYIWFQAQISSQQSKNQLLQTEITRLEGQIKEISTLQQEIAALRARQQAVEDLQADRNLPVHLLNELVRQLPDGVYITTLKQENQVVTLTGSAQSNERVSELLRNTLYNSRWLEKPELVEIKSTSVAQRRLFDFSMRVSLKRPQAATAAAAAASARVTAPAAGKP